MKNRFTRLLAIPIIISLFIRQAPIHAAAQEPPLYGESQLSSLPNTAALRYAYEKMEEGIEKAQESIDLSHAQHKISSEELHTVFNLLFYDHPEFFWLSGGYKYSSDAQSVKKIQPSYNAFAKDLSAFKRALNEKADEFCEGLQGKSDYEISLSLHNRLILAVSYQSSSNDQSAYGALVEGKAVCAGYSRAYQFLLQKMGIPAWSVTGTSYNPANQQKQNHEWNLVSLDGNWYYTDVTWDDQGNTENNIFYSYLNISTKQMEESHTLGAFFLPFVPNATATTANYFTINGGIHSAWNQSALVKLLSENGLTARVYVDMANPKDYLNQFKNNISAITKDLGIVGSYRYNYWELDHEFVFVIDGTVASKTTATPTTTIGQTTHTDTTASPSTTIVAQTTTDKSNNIRPTQSLDIETPTTTTATTATTEAVADVTTTTVSTAVAISAENDNQPLILWIVGGVIGIGAAAVALLLLKKR